MILAEPVSMCLVEIDAEAEKRNHSATPLIRPSSDTKESMFMHGLETQFFKISY